MKDRKQKSIFKTVICMLVVVIAVTVLNFINAVSAINTLNDSNNEIGHITLEEVGGLNSLITHFDDATNCLLMHVIANSEAVQANIDEDINESLTIIEEQLSKFEQEHAEADEVPYIQQIRSLYTEHIEIFNKV